jgi:hypothetical protein
MPDSDIVATGGGQGFPPDNADGTPGLIGKDDYTRELAIKNATRRPENVLAGNFADLQRLGSQVADGTVNVQAAIPAPPGINLKDKNVVTPAQAEASRGEFTRETERTGLIDAPVAPTPPENTSPNPVDPTSTSPVAESRTSATSTSTAAKK